jgi:hypothetical protein
MAGQPVEPRTAEQIEAELRRLEEERRTLEEQWREAREREERAEQFDHIRREARERLNECEMVLDELARHRATGGSAEAALVAARKAHLTAVRALLVQAVALKDVSQLPRARELAREMEALDAEWDMVKEPQFGLPAAIEEIERHARALGDATSAAGLAELKRLQADALQTGEQAFALWRQRRELRRRIEGLVGDLRGQLENIERTSPAEKQE